MFDKKPVTETWYSPSDEITAEYSVNTYEYGGQYGNTFVSVPEIDIEIHGVEVLGVSLKLGDIPLLVSKLKEEIRESL